ncbi:ATP-binding protein [Aliiroseovarius sp. F20344]|uniref:ATP-binding response regulator n=1 Tax=Aliiroseovarius sp. F20344 TaxID=2926414 RepID=UPI001FF5FC04|nr:ATP-binding protein [Aliiroseovarius sp. F20344]MCK0143552.1 ATP-binding protein [Aliiroseovarius sp. F20344]
MLGASWFVVMPIIGLGLIVTGLTFVCLAVIVRLVFVLQRLQRDRVMRVITNVVENDSVSVCLTDPDGAVIYQNDAARQLMGRPNGDVLSVQLADHFAAPASVLYRLQTRAQAKGSASEDVSSSQGLMRISAHLVEDRGYLWRFEKLTDRGVQGRAGEHINLPMLKVSKTGTVLYMNDAARNLLGGRETTIDRIFTELPIQPGTIMQVSGREGAVPALICEVPVAAGRREIYLLPPNAAPELSSEEWAFIDGLPVPLLKLDVGGRITMANRRARDLLGDDKAIGSLMADQVEGLGRSVSEWLREAHAGRHLGRSEIVRATRSDEDVFIQISLAQITEENGTALVAVLQDATELKSLEAQFVQSQKMEAIGQLAGGVAHDFNNLLTAISGHCDLLMMGRDEKDPAYSDLSQIIQNSNRAAALVRQLLAFSRKQTLRPEKLLLTESLSDLTHLLNRLVGEKINLQLDHDAALLPIRADRRQLDQVIMNLVVNARDAMDQGGTIRVETRNVILESALQRDRASVPAGDYVTIRVIDQGTGIPADKLSKIFEPFFTTKKAGKGTGLGLSMAYGIVKQMGGYIFVDTLPDRGTTFTLYFPVSRDDDAMEVFEGGNPAETLAPELYKGRDIELPLNAEGQPKLSTGQSIDEAPIGATSQMVPTVVSGAENTSGGVVLLVEDEAPVRAFASRALKMRGFTVLEADCAEEALQTLEDTALKVDVFVTDVIMPGMDGPTWVAKALDVRPDVKVVFMSGYAEDSVSDHQARIPNSVFLPKPFSLTDLTATVSEQMF